MVEDLSRHYARLEQRVHDKTEELARSNRSLNLLYGTTRRLTERTVTHAALLDTLHDVAQALGIRASALCLGTGGQITLLGDPGPAAEGERLCRNGCPGCDGGNGRLLPLPGADASGRMVAVPLFDGTRNHGAMLLQQANGAELAPWQVELLETIGHHIGTALAATRRNEERHRLALLDERSVIARELHDSLAQALSYLKIQSTLLKRSFAKGDTVKAEAAMQQIDEGLGNAYTQLRELLGTFRLSIGDANLGEAIAVMLEQLKPQTHADIRLQYGLTDTDLEAGQHIHILQLIREAVLNAIKHASARHIDVSCETLADGNIQVQIADDGVGIRGASSAVNHYGLSIMNERASKLRGQLTISEPPSGGTRIHLTFPTSLTRDA